MFNTICRYFFWFEFYSIVGWIIETLLYLVKGKKVVKRGFLFGPLCPIYGTGAVILTALFYGRITNIFLIFILGLLLCGVLEYITHFVMEKLFHAMWWDYSSRRFNIKGRVYLNGLLCFGAGSVLIIKLIQPFVVKITDAIPVNVLYIICFVLYSITIVDLCLTIADLKNVVKTLKFIQSFALSNLQKGIDLTDEAFKELIKNTKEKEIIKELSGKLLHENSLVQRIYKKYPNFTLKKYKYILDIILDKPQKEKARTDIKLYGTADSLPSVDEEEN